MPRGNPPLTRRAFLGAAAALPALWSWARGDDTPPPAVLYRRAPPAVTSAGQVLDVMGFEPLAHDALPPAHFAMFSGLDVSHVSQLQPPDLTLDWLDRLRRQVKARLYIKGIVTGEDAALAVEHGADAVIVSNHGGRNEETLRATIDCLAEVVTAVRRRVPVFVDGGIRRGTDVFKALALGATAVGIGRPEAWGLAAFGQSGVEAVIDILNRELAAIMRQAGTPSVAAITGAAVLRAAG